jgi:DNA mismatch endonuclease, patch repair protein
MADHPTKEKRSWNMSQIHSKNTKPEMVVRSLLHSIGYRFRLHGKVNILNFFNKIKTLLNYVV